MVRLTEEDARKLLGLGRLRLGWVNCRTGEHVEVARCFRCQGYEHVSRDCTLPGMKNACWGCGGASHMAKECKLREHLEESKIIDELGWARSAESLEDTVRGARRKVVAACGHSMPRHGHRRTGDSMYWWNDQFSHGPRE